MKHIIYLICFIYNDKVNINGIELSTKFIANQPILSL